MPYYWNGLTINGQGIYSKTLSNSVGCDSVAQLNVIIVSNTQMVRFDTICFGDSIRFGNQFIKAGGSYQRSLKNSGGCDSTIVMNLFIRPQYTFVINKTGSQLFAPSNMQLYLWYFNNQKIDQANSNTTLADRNGIYKVEVIDMYNCKSQSAEYENILTSGAVFNLNGHTSMQLYPNPTTGVVYIEYPKNIYHIDVLDLHGRKIYEYGKNTKMLDLRNLSLGVYLIKVQTEEGTINWTVQKEE